ncbi:L,D-transpeptidase family protein [Altererythrobacter sp. CC-YST694]|uniref:L,D-transpeptidase family protein n=1 Tax=Altererythrobacter sp. CC-YST694 TaxID=2755038 RepID=UPI001D02DEC4|nr:L,D-transpeptidase family protein [Altererythrobacter sp. CC-YST694]MCB5425004.1 L,D-transpeptidase family protein [Altererythrobacter sp. CC-YST694]
MKRAVLAMIAVIMLAAGSPAMAQPSAWTPANLSILKRWVAMAPMDALPVLSTAVLDKAESAADGEGIAKAADDLALRLAKMHLLGCATAAERKGWNIVDTDKAVDVEALLAGSLQAGTLDAFFASMRPRDPEYAALNAAYAQATDQSARSAIARNMERWRWMPRSLGEDHVLVNAAAFEAGLWREGKKVGTWKVIVGKKSTPTPVFNATITGVNLNPWWEIPASIVRESVGALVRRSPSTARARGYVWGGGRYRQRPGPNNSLGQMKLVMPNPYSVYMHDTPSKSLFERDVRAFSHGCIRTEDAIGYAATLLEGVKTREEVDAIVASRESTVINLARPIPIYVAYFTAVSDGEGGARILPDVYGRDRKFAASRPGCGG